eukprot:m.67099 g.67099  ORF g.67099 m.67099 type:complete len:148 (+) comp23762_c0_seq1:133-576(+)
MFKKRVGVELKNLRKSNDFELISPTEGGDCLEWKVKFYGAEDSLYTGETFVLQFIFGDKYPFDAPQVTFVDFPSPVHEHVYSNGHICMSLLNDDWSPALNAESICQAIASMLGSAKKKERPIDNDRYVQHAPKNPKKTRWAFHDNKC